MTVWSVGEKFDDMAKTRCIEFSAKGRKNVNGANYNFRHKFGKHDGTQKNWLNVCIRSTKRAYVISPSMSYMYSFFERVFYEIANVCVNSPSGTESRFELHLLLNSTLCAAF